MTTAFVPATPAHHAFICNSWVESFRTAHAAGIVADERWRAVMWPEVERIMQRRDARTIVAVDGALILGFACTDPTERPPIVFFAYVKEAYRRQGLASQLLRAAGVDVAAPYRYACKTETVGRILGVAARPERRPTTVTEPDGSERMLEAPPSPARLKLLRLVSMARWDPACARYRKESR